MRMIVLMRALNRKMVADMKYEVHIHRHGCPICGCVSSLPYKDTRWCECLSCGLVYLDRFSRLPEVDDLLHGRQHHFFEDKKIEDFKERFDVKRKGFENRLNLYLQFVNFHDKNLKVCEVGFGGGILLKLLLERGYTNVYGIEVVERYCQHARGIGVPTFWADLSNQSQSHLVINHAFDLVIGNEMMEHVESPVDFMKGVNA